MKLKTVKYAPSDAWFSHTVMLVFTPDGQFQAGEERAEPFIKVTKDTMRCGIYFEQMDTPSMVAEKLRVAADVVDKIDRLSLSPNDRELQQLESRQEACGPK